MPRLLTLLIATLVAGQASAAAAQTWPASTVAGAPRVTPLKTAHKAPARPSSLRLAELRRAADLRTLKLTPTIETGTLPDIDLRARSEWSDDEGFRVTPTRVAFKRRF
ncbi:hypothetical protein [Phenylobacterium kunshanense]|uniref:Uncharacterized protein n=1 Tax=Phenylobacterium kunshanense TaxID=1445034 RepID=A0A328BAJ3_9CAUL|nr:hypothetical protein [Phenylobacterium kunshanense]RAK62058.1 hypothetical protein DJ019_20290 [Phenylobacterium kunshanense]